MQYILDQLGVGTVVEHKKFGEGVIAEMEKEKSGLLLKKARSHSRPWHWREVEC